MRALATFGSYMCRGPVDTNSFLSLSKSNKLPKIKNNFVDLHVWDQNLITESLEEKPRLN